MNNRGVVKTFIIFICISSIIYLFSILIGSLVYALFGLIIGYLGYLIVVYKIDRLREQFFAILIVHVLLAGLTAAELSFYCFLSSESTICQRNPFILSSLPLYVSTVFWLVTRISKFLMKQNAP